MSTVSSHPKQRCLIQTSHSGSCNSQQRKICPTHSIFGTYLGIRRITLWSYSLSPLTAGEIQINQDQMHQIKKSLNTDMTIPTANPSVSQFPRQDLREDQKCLGKKPDIQGSEVPITQRASHNSRSMPKTQDIGNSHRLFHLLLSHCLSCHFLYHHSRSVLKQGCFTH